MSKFILILFVLVLSACSKNEPNCTSVHNDSWKSYYDPIKGTLNLHRGLNPCEVQVIGEPLNGYVAVGSDQAYSVRMITDGWFSTPFVTKTSVNGLRIENDRMVFSSEDQEITMGFNGDLIGTTKNYAKRCTFGSFYCAEDGVYIDFIHYPAQYPRDATRSNGLVYVADTFGHRVAIYDEKSATLVDSFEFYFPNSVQIVGRKMIVAAEHQNQIIEVDLDTRARKSLFGCNLGVYGNANATVLDVVTAQKDLRRDDGRSVCEGVLYSPNHATLYDDGTLLIADTDNHRVLVVKNGKIKTEIRNLNNPTRAVFWRANKEIAK